MANLNDILQRVRAHPGVPAPIRDMGDNELAFTISQVLFPCLDELSSRLGADVFKKHYGFTDPAVVTATLDGNGVVDLAPVIIAHGLLIESLQNGEIRHPSSSQPLVRQAHAGAGPGNYDKIYLHYWLVGMKLHTRSADNNQTPLTGDLSFACPRQQALDTLNPNQDGTLVDMLVARLRGAPLKEDAPK